ncbi:MAG: hypothetical protein HY564_00915 [Candidatus Jacksonbacteria bacterium]|nr:hypothetical protein [Candidatus Jacksonbacteria bacterium]
MKEIETENLVANSTRPATQAPIAPDIGTIVMSVPPDTHPTIPPAIQPERIEEINVFIIFLTSFDEKTGRGLDLRFKQTRPVPENHTF